LDYLLAATSGVFDAGDRVFFDAMGLGLLQVRITGSGVRCATPQYIVVVSDVEGGAVSGPITTGSR